MQELSIAYIRNDLARTPAIFSRGENIFLLGNYTLADADPAAFTYRYVFDGNYGEYEVTVRREPAEDPEATSLAATCTCPYPYPGCKHVVAAFLDIAQRTKRTKQKPSADTLQRAGEIRQEHLTPEEIKQIALQSRRDRAKKENLTLAAGEMFKGQHTVRAARGREYTVTLYSADEERGHCTCPDFAVNHLDTCKHLIFAFAELSRDELFREQAAGEVFPFVHVTWSSRLQKPVCFYECIEDPELRTRIDALFNEKGIYTRDSLKRLFELFSDYSEAPELIQFDRRLLRRMDEMFFEKEAAALKKKFKDDFTFLKTGLYPYQKEGVTFATFRKAAIIADEMGLGKTLQALATALLKRRLFGIEKTLIVCPASLKNQWKREIEKFTDETAQIIAGSRANRIKAYLEDAAFFKITNYEALLRDIGTVRDWSPDFVVLDEAQRIKNFETKTHQAINRVPRSHSLVMTGTPLENRLEDLYAIVQFSDPELLTPLWAFAANHYSMSRTKKNEILGYRNLDTVHEKVKPLLIRRTKSEVFDSLPDVIENTYYLDLAGEQAEVHQGYMSSLLRIINKKFLTPMDLKMIQRILTCMRMVCNSTYLIDKQSNVSPKLVELVSILKELVIGERRKLIIFTEWTTMSYLIGKVLSELAIDFVEFNGKVPAEKRQLLIDEFRENPDCMVFLSTDAGGVGLNLENTDCLVNFELPWNPARLNQRIGRIHRIGQRSNKINVINLITRSSIEERVFAGIGLKQELFDAVIDGAADEVDFSREKKNRFVEQLRRMFGDELGAEEMADDRRGREPEPDELDEKTPHFLNPRLFEPQRAEVDVEEEEAGEAPDPAEPADLAAAAAPPHPPTAPEIASAQEAVSAAETDPAEPAEQRGATRPETAAEPHGSSEKPAAAGPPAQPAEGEQSASGAQTMSPEDLEAVLNQGMAFLNSLTRAATGKPLFDGSSDRKSVEVDPETGEVVLRFKL